MATQKIETPRGSITINTMGKAELKFDPSFVDKWEGRYTEAQKFVDSEVLRQSEPYTPLLSGMLVKSGTLGTKIGSGLVTWIAPYARRHYYAKRKPGSETGPLRGPYWFQRMKEVWGDYIVRSARRLAGGGK